MAKAPNSVGDPLASLPAELVAAIFERCIPVALRDVLPSKLRAPLQLTQVCHSWRILAHSTPSLWTSLTLLVIHDSRESYLQFVKEWLDRSATMPLDICLINSRIPVSAVTSFNGRTEGIQQSLTDSQLAASELVLSEFIARCSRWRTADFELHRQCFGSSVWSAAPQNPGLPLLRTLVVDDAGLGNGYYLFTARFPALTAAPNLRRFVANGAAMHYFIQLVPWSQLTAADTAVFRRHHCEQIIKRSRFAISLRLKANASSWGKWSTGYDGNPTYIADLTKCNLGYLSKLSIEVDVGMVLGDIMDMVTAPYLEVLHLRTPFSVSLGWMQSLDLLSGPFHRLLLRIESLRELSLVS
jgi:hypothetical protein